MGGWEGGWLSAAVRGSLGVHLKVMEVTNLCPDESLEAGLEVVDAALVELGHLVQELLVLGLEVIFDRSEFLFCLWCRRERAKQKNWSLRVQFWLWVTFFHFTAMQYTLHIKDSFAKISLRSYRLIPTKRNKLVWSEFTSWAIICLLLLLFWKIFA